MDNEHAKRVLNHTPILIVAITTNSPKYWDDGIKNIFGPWQTQEQAEEWCNKFVVGQRPTYFEVTIPEVFEQMMNEQL